MSALFRDPGAYIWSVNIARRHLTKGQIAMSGARMRSVSEQSMRHAANISKVSATRITEATTVLQFAPELADEVMSGFARDEAYAIATRRKKEASRTEAKMARLQENAPDLAELVAEERMSLDEASAAAHQRAEERRQTIEAGRRASEGLTGLCTAALTIKAAHDLGERGLVNPSQLQRIELSVPKTSVGAHQQP